MQSLEEKEKLYYFYVAVKPVFTTYLFELKKQWKKFIAFSMVSVVFVILLSYLPYALIPDNPLPETQAEYFQSGLNFIIMIFIFAACFFFGGIICEEFGNKTGYITFPIINKYKLIIGKYLGGITLIIGVVSAFYLTLGILGIYYYGGPINYRFYYSFGIAVLYVFTVSSFVTLFSSFMKNVSMSIVSTIMLLLIANILVDWLLTLLYPNFEPIYSLDHASKLISYVLEKDFPTETVDRYEQVEIRGFNRRIWLTPTIETGITVLILYTTVSIIVASIIFKRRQL